MNSDLIDTVNKVQSSSGVQIEKLMNSINNDKKEVYKMKVDIDGLNDKIASKEATIENSKTILDQKFSIIYQ